MVGSSSGIQVLSLVGCLNHQYAGMRAREFTWLAGSRIVHAWYPPWTPRIPSRQAPNRETAPNHAQITIWCITPKSVTPRLSPTFPLWAWQKGKIPIFEAADFPATEHFEPVRFAQK
jgi:hypothetical protein